MPRSIYNRFRFNTGHYKGGYIGQAATFLTDLVVFDGFSLSDGTYMVCTDLRESAPEREVVTGAVPRDDGEYVNGDFWRKKPIEVEGYIKASTATALENYLDTVKKGLRKRERFLDITRKDGSTIISVRRFTATWMNPEALFWDRARNDVTKCPFTARFHVHGAFGYDRQYTVTDETLTVSPTTVFAENVGSAVAKPVITLLFDAASSVTVVNVKRVDPVSGVTLEEIEYSGAIAAGDWLSFDSEKLEARLNGTKVNPVGSFLTMPPGGNLYKFTITGASFIANAAIKAKNAYL